jgi:hypothetical protein
MSVLSILASARFETAPARAMARRGARWMLMGVGFAFIAVGLVGALLPTHLLGVFMVIGLAIVMRASYSARRTFIRVQRRHPKYVFPLRRLLRREPEVMPVAWQQVLRTEKAILPRRWRFAGRTRRHVVRSRRRR